MLDAELITGWDAIDAHHSIILEMMDEFTNLTIAERQEQMDKLTSYVHEHCERELELMRFYRYPMIETHRFQHEHLFELVMGAAKEILSTTSLESVERLIVRKLREHILTYDKELVRWIHEHEETNPGVR